MVQGYFTLMPLALTPGPRARRYGRGESPQRRGEGLLANRKRGAGRNLRLRVPSATKGDGSMLVQEQKIARPLRFSMRQRRMLAGYLFISPVVLGYLIWVAGPMI